MCVDTLFLSTLPGALYPQHNNDNHKATPEWLGGNGGVRKGVSLSVCCAKRRGQGQYWGYIKEYMWGVCA